MRKEIIELAKDQLLKYPYVKPWKKVVKKYVDSIFLERKFFLQLDKYNWPNTMLAIGLARNGNISDVKKYVDNFIGSGPKIRALDTTMIGTPAMYIYLKTKDKKYLELCDQLFQYLVDHKKDNNGSLYYRESGKDILVDMIGMVCPFLMEYHKVTADREAKKIAEAQILNFIKYGMDEKTGLPYHGYNAVVKLGIIGWGRAVGWLAMGISGYLEHGGDREEIIEFYDNLVGTIISCQDSEGAIHWQLQAFDGPSDTSATAMIFSSIYKKIDKKSLQRARGYLVSNVTASGVRQCSAECGGVGVYPQQYGEYPWSLGPTLELLG
jgi:rhamnogalacturonyl hydrolase YesR